jgi:4-hydroxybenzoate polyprenyltransferase
MKEFLKLVRWPNLLMIVLTMVLMRYAIIAPLVEKLTIVTNNGEVTMQLQSSLFDFILLVLATVLITAGGYVINDYFDIKADLINRGKVIVGTGVPRRQAIMLHSVLNVAGVLIGFYISHRAGYTMMGALFLIVSGLLYFYSASYKKQFLVGNIIVSLLTAMVPMLVALYEWPAVYRHYAAVSPAPPVIDFILYWVGGFAVFAFLMTLAREIIKDIEDFEGDTEYGKNTVPVVAGIKTARFISVSILVITIALIYLAWHFFVNDRITLIYISLAVIVPLLYVIYLVIFGRKREDLHSASNFMKIAMLSGILYSIVVKIILTWNLF